MFHTKLGLEALGLCALVTGVMAIGTTGAAQAEVGACWGFLAGAELRCLTKTNEAAAPALALENNTGTLLIANQTFSVLCTGMEFDEGAQLSENGSILPGKIKFKGCVTLIKGVISKPCEPFNGTEKGVILTEKGEGLIKLHELTATKELEPTVLIKPVTSETVWRIHLGTECSVGEEILVKGELVLWDCKGKASFEEHKVTHLFEEFPGLKLMKVGANAATFDGSVNVTLTGAQLGFKWAGKAA